MGLPQLQPDARDDAGATVPARRRVAAALRAEHADPHRDVPPRDRYLAQERAAFVREVEQRIDTAGGTQAEACAWVGTWRHARFPLLQTAGRRGTSAMTEHNFRRWRKALGRRAGRTDTANWPSLVPQYRRGDRGRRGDERWWEMFYALWLTQNELPISQAYQLACQVWRRAKLPDAGVPAQHHVRYWHREHGDRLAELLARRGDTWFRTHVQGYIQRDWSSIEVGEVWIGDHRLVDWFIKAPGPDGEMIPQRCWLTAWRDARSGHFTSYLLYPGGEAPNADTIIQCLILAIHDNGNCPPKILYIDNGRDYCAGGFTEPVTIAGVEMSVCRALGIEVIHAIAFNPQAKPIENSFGTLIPYVDRRMPGYIGSSPGNRPEHAWQLARERVHDLPSLQQANELFAIGLHEHEQRQTHSLIQGGVPTSALWDGRARVREPLTDEQLRLACLRPTTETRQIRRTPDGPGIVWETAGYSCPELRDYARRHWGEDVRVFTDPFAQRVDRIGRDLPDRVWAAQPDGTLIGCCRVAGAQPAIARSDEEREALAAAMSDVRRLLPQTKRTVRRLKAGRTGAPYDVLAGIAREHGLLPPADSAPGDSPNLPNPETRAPNPGTPDHTESAPFPDDADPALVAELDRIMHTAPAGAQEDETEDSDLRLLAALAQHERRMRYAEDEDIR